MENGGLNKAEYDTAYGNDGNIHFGFPLPKLLKRLFTSVLIELKRDRTPREIICPGVGLCVLGGATDGGEDCADLPTLFPRRQPRHSLCAALR